MITQLTSKILLNYLDSDLSHTCDQGHIHCADQENGMCSLDVELELEMRGVI